jgi:hypothetical protein
MRDDIDFALCSRLASDLAGSGIDHNTASRALAYLRAEQSGTKLFDYLRAINQHSDVVRASNQTPRYYTDLLAACERHLRPLQHDPRTMAQILGWAIRLLRYYRAVPDFQPGQEAALSEPPPVEPPPKAAPTLPQVGEIFTSAILDADESLVVLAVPGFDEQMAVAVIHEHQRGTRSYRIGGSARVEVLKVAKGSQNLTVLEVRPVQAEGQGKKKKKKK